ncbi:hypothetical protein ROZALSC1DRAFT_21311 [Rozella allomycis CSF55]|uniref:Transmembrane protein n=1 Tax=Rozella allomycis (strain CSF55) TaxID=988480 RepID=A0A4P9YLJ5_ROZAC|nr:hypothetical protein ROZALSC1DRAFT_21311 [Rozella allomycis CSF55]
MQGVRTTERACVSRPLYEGTGHIVDRTISADVKNNNCISCAHKKDVRRMYQLRHDKCLQGLIQQTFNFWKVITFCLFCLLMLARRQLSYFFGKFTTNEILLLRYSRQHRKFDFRAKE